MHVPSAATAAYTLPLLTSTGLPPPRQRALLTTLTSALAGGTVAGHDERPDAGEDRGECNGDGVGAHSEFDLMIARLRLAPPSTSSLSRRPRSADPQYNQRVSVISAAVSIGVCVLVLLLAAWVWSIRSARGFLDRVSFRLLLWSMFFEIIYDVNYIAVVESASPVSADTAAACGMRRGRGRDTSLQLAKLLVGQCLR